MTYILSLVLRRALAGLEAAATWFTGSQLWTIDRWSLGPAATPAG